MADRRTSGSARNERAGVWPCCRTPALVSGYARLFAGLFSLYSLPRGRCNEAEQVISARYSMLPTTRILSEISALPTSFFRYHLKKLVGSADIENPLIADHHSRGSVVVHHTHPVLKVLLAIYFRRYIVKSRHQVRLSASRISKVMCTLNSPTCMGLVNSSRSRCHLGDQ